MNLIAELIFYVSSHCHRFCHRLKVNRHFCGREGKRKTKKGGNSILNASSFSYFLWWNKEDDVMKSEMLLDGKINFDFNVLQLIRTESISNYFIWIMTRFYDMSQIWGLHSSHPSIKYETGGRKWETFAKILEDKSFVLERVTGKWDFKRCMNTKKVNRKSATEQPHKIYRLRNFDV